jgi:hypothetical protein
MQVYKGRKKVKDVKKNYVNKKTTIFVDSKILHNKNINSPLLANYLTYLWKYIDMDKLIYKFLWKIKQAKIVC